MPLSINDEVDQSSLASEGIDMDIVPRLEAARDRTLKYFELNNEQLARSYGPGKWPVRFILHHLADAETVLFDRIRRIISEPRQVLWAFDQDSWAGTSTILGCHSICLAESTIQSVPASSIRLVSTTTEAATWNSSTVKQAFGR